MIVEFKNCSDIEKIQLILQGVSFAMYLANNDKMDYERYQSDSFEGTNSEREEEMKVLSILDRLGYPMNELGTYLYKDVICAIIKVLSVDSSREKQNTLLKQLQNSFSSFYHFLAREEKEIGVKTFHLYIQNAICEIDEKSADVELLRQIYGNLDDLDYGENAFQIASFYLKMPTHDQVDSYSRPLIKKLGNFPDDIALKGSF